MIEAVRHYLTSFHTARKVQGSGSQHVLLLHSPPPPPSPPHIQGTIAKKPYNPVLGETFQCYWDLPGDDRGEVPPEGEELVRSGPVPFAHPTSFTFVAEQVSHHPPGEHQPPRPPTGQLHATPPSLLVSAFYAESPLKKICIEGYVYTQSRFLGLSLGVHNIGKGGWMAKQSLQCIAS